MPIFRGNTPGLPSLPTQGQPGQQAPIIPEIGAYLPVWYPPDGTRLNLNPGRSDFMSLRSVSGLGAVPVDAITTPSADGGVIVEYIRAKERTVLWPLRMRADTHMDFVTLWRSTMESFTQCRRYNKPGKLRLTRPDGTAREIPAFYASGFEQDPEEGAWTEQTAVVNLLCPAPWWQDVDLIEREWLQEAGVDYLNPYPSFGSGAVIGAASMRNDGVEPAWPTWTIRGPLTSLVAANTTRGESFTITKTLTVGQVMTISTRPIQVRGPAGEQAINTLNLLTGGIPWRLDAKATTNITFTAAGSANETAPGAGDGTSIKMSFVQRRESS